MSFKYTWLRAAQRIGFVADFLQLPGSTADFMPPKEIRPTIKKIISPDYNHDNPDSGIERLAHRLELVGLASLLMSARFYQTERDSLQDYLIDNFQPVQSEKEAEELTPINVNRRHDTSNSYCGKDSDEVSEINPKTLRDTLEYLAEHIQIMATHPYDSPAFSCAVKAATKLPGLLAESIAEDEDRILDRPNVNQGAVAELLRIWGFEQAAAKTMTQTPEQTASLEKTPATKVQGKRQLMLQ